MKNFYTLLLLLLSAFTFAQNIEFTDPNFKEALLSIGGMSYYSAVDVNGNSMTIDINQDNEIQINEAQAVKELYLNGPANYISNLDGIEYFINLKKLNCEGQGMTSLDVTSLTLLEELNCSQSENLTNLNITGLSLLKKLYCQLTEIISIDLSGVSNLEELTCYNTSIGYLDISQLSNIRLLDISYCLFTNPLDLSGLTLLKELNCSSNNIPNLNLSGDISLEILFCYDNIMTSLDLHENLNLIDVNCDSNNLTELNVSGLNNLLYLTCINNELEQMNLSNTSLISFSCHYNNLTSLNVSGCTYLATINCFSNQLTTFDITNNQHITDLNIDSNNLESLYLKNNTSNYINVSFYDNPSLIYICADEALIPYLQMSADLNGNTDCVITSECSLGTSEFDLNKAISLYPNPADNDLNFSSNNIIIDNVEIYNLMGQLILKSDLKSTASIDISNLLTGSYLIKINSATGFITRKFIKM